MAKAIWNDRVIAAGDDILVVDGHPYFPRDAVDASFLRPSRRKTLCPYKGVCSYYSLEVDGRTNENAAFYYPHPIPTARRLKGRIAFWKDVRIEP